MAISGVHVIMLAARGGRLTSPGLWTMASKLRSMGAIVELYGSASWHELVPYVANVKASNRRLVLVGYSLGAMRAIDMCNLLAAREDPVTVDLLFTIVPPHRQFSFNVLRAVNHTVRGGRALDWWSDFIQPVTPAHNYRVTNHDYASVAGLSHYTMQFHPKVHASLVEEVGKL